MTDTTETVEEGQQQPQEEASALRRAAAEGAEARRQADALARENAFLKAGIDIDTPMGKMFAKAYEGELDKEAVTAAWNEVAPPAPTQPPATPPSPVSPETQERMSLASDSVPAGGVPDEDPRVAGMKAFEAAMARGTPREDAAAEFINRVVDAGVKGDSRALYVPPQDR